MSAVFPAQINSADTLPDNPSILPPPLPVKFRDSVPQESPPATPPPPAQDKSCESPAPLSRSSGARVSFREPISSSYSVDEDDDEDEDEDENEEELQEDEGNQQDEDEEEGGFGSRLHLQKGIPPQMDLLGEERVEY